MPSSHLILRCPLFLPSIFPSIRVFSNESALHIRWPKYWGFSFNISPSSEHSGLISSRMDWLDLLAVQGTPHSSVIQELLNLRPSTRWQRVPELGPSVTGCVHLLRFPEIVSRDRLSDWGLELDFDASSSSFSCSLCWSMPKLSRENVTIPRVFKYLLHYECYLFIKKIIEKKKVNNENT